MFFFEDKSTAILSLQKQASDWKLTQLFSFYDACSLYDIFPNFSRNVLRARSDKSQLPRRKSRKTPKELWQ